VTAQRVGLLNFNEKDNLLTSNLGPNQSLNSSRIQKDNNNNNILLDLSMNNQSQDLESHLQNKDSRNYQKILQDKINDAYKNLNNIKKTINNISLNNSRVQTGPNPNPNHSMFNHSVIGMDNSQTLESPNRLPKDLIPKNFMSEKRDFRENPISISSNRTFSQINQLATDETSSIMKMKLLSNRNNTKYNIEDDYRILREENENIYLTNQILNKSNMDLKNQLKQLEAELESLREFKLQLNEANSINHNLREELAKYDRANTELVTMYENLQNDYGDLVQENKKIQSQYDNLNQNLSLHEKTNQELKSGLESVEEILKNYDNEKSIMNLHMNEKDKQILELTDKLALQEDLNEKIRKSIQDYEEMLSSMKKTIEILKKSGHELENEVFKLKCTIDDKDMQLELGHLENSDKDKVISSLTDDVNLLKNDISHLYNDISLKDKDLEECLKNNRNIISDIDKLKSKNENLNKILIEKENIILNMKSSYELVNHTLEEVKRDNEYLKTKSEGEFFDKSRNQKNKEIIESLNSELHKRTEELNKYRDTFHKNLLNLETEINEYKHKINLSQMEIKNLENDLSNKNEELQKLNNNLNNEKEENKKLENLHNFALEKLTRLEKENNELKISLSGLKIEISNLNKITDNKDESYKSLLNDKDKWEEINYNLKEKISKLEAELMNTNDKYMQIMNDASMTDMTIKSENFKLLEENKRKEKNIESLNQKIEELSDLMKNMRDSKDKMKKNYDNTIFEMKKSLSSKTIDEESFKREIEKLNNLIKDKNKEIEDYKEKIDESEENYDDIKKLNDELLGENKILKENNQKLENQNNSMLEKLDTFKSKYEDYLVNSEDMNKKYQELMRLNGKINAECQLMKEKYEKVNTELTYLLKEKNLKRDEGDLLNKDTGNNHFKNEKKETSVKNLDSNNSVVKLPSKTNYNNMSPSKTAQSEKNLNYTINNSKNEILKKSDTLTILEGTKFLFRVYDNKRILRFDIENREFKVIEFADFGYFEDNFTAEGSIYLNILDGLFIVTGDNHDMLYHYSHSKGAMNKLAKLNDNHSHGSLIFNEKDKNLICLSGWHNRKVEKYYNPELLKGYLTTEEKEGSSSSVSSFNKKQPNPNIWFYLPEMTVERSESSYVIINNSQLYAFFGYCCPKMRYLDTIECLNLAGPARWELVKYSNETHLSTFIKSHTVVKLDESEIIIIGGFDGSKETPVENLINFSFTDMSINLSERKLPDIIHNHCFNFQKDSMPVPFIDDSYRLHFAMYDEMDNAHVVEVKSVQYDLFKFE
jgi:chromosome segregation ATPase